MAQNDAKDEYEYEYDSFGRRFIVRSYLSTHRVLIRFTNTTNRTVLVWWRNFQGKRQLYAKLEPGEFYDITTYLTHPWSFSDYVTRERFVVMNRKVFRPPQWLGKLNQRTNWNITIPVRSLRISALIVVASHLSVKNVDDLDLPKTLAMDLKSACTIMNWPPVVIPTDWSQQRD